jgi:hypothetical protein
MSDDDPYAVDALAEKAYAAFSSNLPRNLRGPLREQSEYVQLRWQAAAASVWNECVRWHEERP